MKINNRKISWKPYGDKLRIGWRISAILSLILVPFFRPQVVKGKEILREAKRKYRNQGLIVAGTHVGKIDMYVFGAILGPFFPVRWVAKESLNMPVIGRILRFQGAIFTKRELDDHGNRVKDPKAGRQMLDALKANHWLGIYPKGGFEQTEGFEAYAEVVKLAKHKGIPILVVRQIRLGKFFIYKLKVEILGLYIPTGDVEEEAQKLKLLIG